MEEQLVVTLCEGKSLVKVHASKDALMHCGYFRSLCSERWGSDGDIKIDTRAWANGGDIESFRVFFKILCDKEFELDSVSFSTVLAVMKVAYQLSCDCVTQVCTKYIACVHWPNEDEIKIWLRRFYENQVCPSEIEERIGEVSQAVRDEVMKKWEHLKSLVIKEKRDGGATIEQRIEFMDYTIEYISILMDSPGFITDDNEFQFMVMVDLKVCDVCDWLDCDDLWLELLDEVLDSTKEDSLELALLIYNTSAKLRLEEHVDDMLDVVLPKLPILDQWAFYKHCLLIKRGPVYERWKRSCKDFKESEDVIADALALWQEADKRKGLILWTKILLDLGFLPRVAAEFVRRFDEGIADFGCRSYSFEILEEIMKLTIVRGRVYLNSEERLKVIKACFTFPSRFYEASTSTKTLMRKLKGTLNGKQQFEIFNLDKRGVFKVWDD